LTSSVKSKGKPFLEPISKISCGSAHFFFLTVSRKCFCFGKNEYGQLGLGDDVSRREPVEFQLKSKTLIKKIVCGGHHTFILTEDFKCLGFGWNVVGQLGLGNAENKKSLSVENKKVPR